MFARLRATVGGDSPPYPHALSGNVRPQGANRARHGELRMHSARAVSGMLVARIAGHCQRGIAQLLANRRGDARPLARPPSAATFGLKSAQYLADKGPRANH